MCYLINFREKECGKSQERFFFLFRFEFARVEDTTKGEETAESVGSIEIEISIIQELLFLLTNVD